MTATNGLEAEIRLERDDGFVLDMSLALPARRTVALLGPNGAGKSTVVDALVGLLPLHEGRIVLDGTALDDPAAGVFVPPERRHIGSVFQDYVLFPHLDVVENVAFGLRSRGVARRMAYGRAMDWLRSLGLEALAGRRTGELSGGQAQRVALARALVTEPKLLLLDEPLAALDVSTRSELRHVLAEHLSEFAGPRLLITHDPMEAFLLADEICVLEDGRVSQIGTAEEIRLSPRTGYAADLAGANLLRGVAADGTVAIDGHELHIAGHDLDGPVLATIHSRAIALHRTMPQGSPRNTWRTRLTRLEHYGDRVRVQTGGPLALTAEVTPDAVHALDLVAGVEVWVSIKATEIGVQPD